MYESFRYIHTPPFEHKRNDVIDNKYDKYQIRGKFVVFSTKGGYRVYQEMKNFIKEFNDMTVEQRVFHEVIMPLSQKLKFDIDAHRDAVLKFNPINNHDVIEDDFDNIAPIDSGIAGNQDIIPVTPSEKYKHILKTITDAVHMAFFLTYRMELTPDRIIVCESGDNSSNDVGKYSNHLIIDGYYVPNDVHAAEFTRQVRGLLPAVYHQFIDMSVNKSMQNFRLAGCHKDDDLRIKRIITAHSYEQSFITNVDGCEELRLPVALEKKLEEEAERLVDLNSCELGPSDYKNVMALCEADGIMQHHTLRRYQRGLFMFSRLSASWCDICGAEHTRDHSVIVSIRACGGILTAFRQCRRYLHNHGADGRHFVKIGEVGTEMVTGLPPKTHEHTHIAKWTSDKIRYTLELIKNPHAVNPSIKPSKKLDENGALITPMVKRMRSAPHTDLFLQLPADMKHTYSESKLRPFEPARTLVVHAAMKMGKTKTLVEYMNKYFADGIVERKIRIISFRQTFSGNLKEKFPNYTVYNEVTGPLTQPKLIIQVESLHRLDIRAGDEPPDLLVMDECEAIFEQFDSGLLRGNFNDCFAKFQYLMRFSKHIVCMDAGISDRTFRVLHQMRPGFLPAEITLSGQTLVIGDRKPVIRKVVPTFIDEDGRVQHAEDGDPFETVYHHCTYKNATDDTYYFTGDKLIWLGILYSTIEADERIAVPTSSLVEAKVLERNIMKKYPNKKVRLYSSETSSTEKRTHFSDVNAYWGELSVLIYTPTVSAGVSFELTHFDKVFGYFTDQSCPVETCIQMIGRIRNVSSKNLYVCLNARGNNLPTTTECLKSYAASRVDNLNRGFDDTGLRIEFEANGEKKYHHGDYFTLWLENTRIKNISKNFFIQAFMGIIHRGGSSMEEITDEVFEEFTGSPPMIDGVLNDELAEIKLAHNESREELKAIEVEKLVSARDISFEEMEEIKEIIQSQGDLTEEQKYQYDRFRLRAVYMWTGPIDKAFVIKYNTTQSRRVYRNLTRLNMAVINENATIEEQLAHIKKEEQAVNRYFMDNDDYYGDLNRKYVYDQHRYALSLLKLCGWNSIVDPEFQHACRLAVRLRRDEALYWQAITPACVEFGMRTPFRKIYKTDEELISGMLPPVNKILSIMYGINIAPQRRTKDMYSISKCSLFAKDAESSAKLSMPYIH